VKVDARARSDSIIRLTSSGTVLTSIRRPGLGKVGGTWLSASDERAPLAIGLEVEFRIAGEGSEPGRLR
jgi:hypothetical protein